MLHSKFATNPRVVVHDGAANDVTSTMAAKKMIDYFLPAARYQSIPSLVFVGDCVIELVFFHGVHDLFHQVKTSLDFLFQLSVEKR